MARILIVDDNEALRSIIAEFLRVHGHDCAEAANVGQARMHLMEKRFDLAVSDYRMPNESGLDLLRYVTARFPSMYFILMSGSLDRDLRRRARTLGALCCLSKPFKLSELMQIVQIVFQPLSSARLQRRSLH
jgi:DNA-binding NtrC family response regulator